MNYFELYPGDYRRDTARLSLAEHGAYLLLMTDYYASEKPLPADLTALCRIAGAQGRAEQQAVKSVAEQYFPIAEDGLRHNKRADAEIAKFGHRSATSSQNRESDRERQRRTRERRTQMFMDLRDVGVVPDGLVTMDELRALHREHVTVNVTRDRSRDAAVNRHEKTAVNTATTSHEPQATSQVILSASLQSESSTGLETNRASACAQPPAARITAGEACRAMREAGIASTNSAHPKLQALVNAGATGPQFAQAAAIAAAKGKGFGYAMGVLEGQLADAAAPPKPGRNDPEMLHVQNHSVAAAWLAEGGTV